MDSLLKHCPVVIELPVLWGEMDAFGHVNNVAYFRYFESARIAYLEKILFAERQNADGIGPILASTRCRFKIPLTYPDTISVGTRVSEIQHDRFTMEYFVASLKHRSIAAEGDSVVVAFNYGLNHKATLPPIVRARIAELETKAKK